MVGFDMDKYQKKVADLLDSSGAKIRLQVAVSEAPVLSTLFNDGAKRALQIQP